MSVSNIHTSVELPSANSTYNYNFLSAKSIRRDTHKLRGTNSPKPSVSIIDEITNSDCCSTQPASSAKPSRESLAVSEIEVSGKSAQKFACFEVDETLYHLPSQEISPVSSISELSSETEIMEANKLELDRPFKTTYGTIDTEESAEEFPKIKSIQSVRLSPLALLKTFLDPVSPKGSDNERITFKKSSFYKREQDSQNNSRNSDLMIPPQKNLYNTAASFEAPSHKRKAIGKFYAPSHKLSLFKETNEPSILSQTNGNISLPQTPKLQSPKGNSSLYQLNNKTAGSITVLTTKKQEVIRISRGLNGFDSGDRNILKSSLEFYKPKTHNKFDVNNFYRQPEEKLF